MSEINKFVKNEWNTKWTPNYNGVNSYVEIPEWKPSGEFEIECDIYLSATANAYILEAKVAEDTSQKALSFGADGLTLWNTPDVEYLSDRTTKLGFSKVHVKASSWVQSRGFTRIGGRFEGQFLKGQISNLKLIDKENKENSRFYPGIIYSYVDPNATDVPMPTTDILVNEWDTGKVVGENITWTVNGQGSINPEGHIVFTGAGQAKSNFNMLKGKQYKVTISLSSGDTEIAYMSGADTGGFAKFKNPIDVQWLNVTRDGTLGINVKGACTLYKILIEETTDGVMFNFGNTQPHVPLLGDREEYAGDLNNRGVRDRELVSNPKDANGATGSFWQRAKDIPAGSILTSQGKTQVVEESGQYNSIRSTTPYDQHAFQYPNTFLVVKPTDPDYSSYMHIEGPASIKDRGWYTFSMLDGKGNPGVAKVFQWSTSQSFKYMEEKGNTLKFYVEGDEHFERDPIIFCNYVTDHGDYSAQLQVSAISAPESSIEAPQAVISMDVVNGIAHTRNVSLNANMSLSAEGATYRWTYDSDQLKHVTQNGAAVLLDLASMLDKQQYTWDGVRGYVNVTITLEMIKDGCVVSTAQEHIIVPDELIKTFP